MKVLLPIVAGMLLAAGPLSARELEAPTASPAAQPSADPDEPICRRVVVVGSRLPGPRVCRTKAQWEGSSRDDQDAVRSMQQSRANLPNGGG